MNLVALALPLLSPVFDSSAPRQTLNNLLEGNARFVQGAQIRPNQTVEKRKELAKGQAPKAVIVTCSDSRVSPELIMDQGLGDLFVVRLAGNTLEARGLGSVEYAVEVLGARLIMVVGHSECGAVKAAIDGKPLPGKIGAAVDPIKPAAKKSNLQQAIQNNVRLVEKKLKNDGLYKKRVADGSLLVVGAEYDLASGKVKLVD